MKHKHRPIARRQLSTERSRLTRSTAPLKRKSGAPMSFLGPPVSSSGSVVSSSEATGSDFLRSRISTTLTVIRCNQVEKADSPRKVPILRKSCRKLPASGLPHRLGYSPCAGTRRRRGGHASGTEIQKPQHPRSGPGGWPPLQSPVGGLARGRRIGIAWSVSGQRSNSGASTTSDAPNTPLSCPGTSPHDLNRRPQRGAYSRGGFPEPCGLAGSIILPRSRSFVYGGSQVGGKRRGLPGAEIGSRTAFWKATSWLSGRTIKKDLKTTMASLKQVFRS